MRLAISGAGGFIGRAVTRQLSNIKFDGSVRLIDRRISGHSKFECMELDLTVPGVLDRALEGVDRVLHLAALPGEAAQADPALSRKINLDLPLDLIDEMKGRRLVYASSIAVFGDSFEEVIDDDTVPNPASVYGTHKRMVELAFADAVRRETVTGAALRLPGIVARPESAEGFGSAFLSDVFRAVRRGEAYVLPISRDATSWLMSVQYCAENLVHALLSDFTIAQAMTLNSVHTRIDELVNSAARYGDADQIGYEPDPVTQRLFGSHPPLKVKRAEKLGFRSDQSVDSLVDNVMRDIGFDESLPDGRRKRSQQLYYS